MILGSCCDLISPSLSSALLPSLRTCQCFLCWDWPTHSSGQGTPQLHQLHLPHLHQLHPLVMLTVVFSVRCQNHDGSDTNEAKSSLLTMQADANKGVDSGWDVLQVIWRRDAPALIHGWLQIIYLKYWQPVVESVVEIINMPATTPLDTIVPVSFHFTQCMEQTQCLEQHPLYLQISLYGCRKESLNECDTPIPPLTTGHTFQLLKQQNAKHLKAIIRCSKSIFSHNLGSY